MNKQPFYHSCELLFTATEDIPESTFREVIEKAFKKLKKYGLLLDSIDIVGYESEPGDPADLM